MIAAPVAAVVSTSSAMARGPDASSEVAADYEATLRAALREREAFQLAKRQLIELLGPTTARAIVPELLGVLESARACGYREGLAVERLSRWPPPRLLRALGVADSPRSKPRRRL